MKQKTSKMRKMERERFSILTDKKTCFICGKSPCDTHEIWGGCNRQVSMKNGFCVPLCRECHEYITNNSYLSFKLKEICQKKFEETHTHEEFMKLIGKNYL